MLFSKINVHLYIFIGKVKILLRDNYQKNSYMVVFKLVVKFIDFKVNTMNDKLMNIPNDN